MAKRLMNKFYINADGDRANTAQEDSVGWGIDVLDPAHVPAEGEAQRVLHTEQHLLSEYPDWIQTASALLGMLQKIGDACTKQAGDEITETVQTMHERLVEGSWVIRRGSGAGPRPTMLLNAIMEAFKAAGGEDTEEAREFYKGQIATDEGKTAALNTPQVKAIYERLRAEAAADRAAKAAEAATGAEASDFLAGFNAS